MNQNPFFFRLGFTLLRSSPHWQRHSLLLDAAMQAVLPRTPVTSSPVTEESTLERATLAAPDKTQPDSPSKLKI